MSSLHPSTRRPTSATQDEGLFFVPFFDPFFLSRDALHRESKDAMPELALFP